MHDRCVVENDARVNGKDEIELVGLAGAKLYAKLVALCVPHDAAVAAVTSAAIAQCIPPASRAAPAHLGISPAPLAAVSMPPTPPTLGDNRTNFAPYFPPSFGVGFSPGFLGAAHPPPVPAPTPSPMLPGIPPTRRQSSIPCVSEGGVNRLGVGLREWFGPGWRVGQHSHTRESRVVYNSSLLALCVVYSFAPTTGY
jgi:hypothetical protein